MSKELVDLTPKDGNDLKNLCAYGDTLNDGKVQISFTLPVPNDEKGAIAAKQLVQKMGLSDINIAHAKSLDAGFTFYIAYGSCSHSVDYTKIKAIAEKNNVMSMEEVNNFIRLHFARKLVVIGASTGTDAHTVGIDAIMNRKGFAGHYGLERYEMIEALNMGSQVPNEVFVNKAKEIKADILLVSQTVTQKDIHIKNLTELVELMDAENLRDNMILVCGGARITQELAKELGFDAGFGAGKFAEDVISFAVNEMLKRGMK